MITSDTTARHILGREIAAALPLQILMDRVRESTSRPLGSARTFEQELGTRPDDFRLLDPWTGPWKENPRRIPADRTRWIQLRIRVDRGPARCRSETVLAETLRVVGVTVEADSFTALARWLHLVAEAGRTWEAAYASGAKRPERHSSSTSESTSENPALAAAA